jgi:hypothetical protein
MLSPTLRRFDARAVKPEPKTVDRFYETPAYKAWRTSVIARAGARCEWSEDGERCAKAAPQHRLFADHVREVRDGGAPLDLDNGQCLCGSHHTRKTAAARATRLSAEG